VPVSAGPECEEDGMSESEAVSGRAGLRPSCWAIVGPTAVGKTDTAIELSELLSLEVIGLDSRQLYKRLNIGTAKPTPEERAAVPHHMIDLIDPDVEWDAMIYAKRARELICDVESRGLRPLIVGGTGFYLDGLMGKISETLPKRSEGIRSVLHAELESHGRQALWERLNRLDPTAAIRLHPRDKARVVRALEIIEISGRPYSEMIASSRARPWREWNIVVLSMERERLRKRIGERVDKMIEKGWVEEVERLLEAGYGTDCQGMSSVGYSEIAAAVTGKLSLDEAKERVVHRTWHFAKRQITWFRRFPSERWISVEERTTAAPKVLKLFTQS